MSNVYGSEDKEDIVCLPLSNRHWLAQQVEVLTGIHIAVRPFRLFILAITFV